MVRHIAGPLIGGPVFRVVGKVGSGTPVHQTTAGYPGVNVPDTSLRILIRMIGSQECNRRSPSHPHKSHDESEVISL